MLLEAAGQLALVTWSLHRKTWPEASRGLLSVSGRRDPERGSTAIRAVDLAAKGLPTHPSCLPQALAVQRMLRRRGVAGRVEFDLPDPVSGAPGHAWVELDLL